MIRLEQLLNTPARGGLGKVVQRAQDMGELTQILRNRLHPELAEALLAANLREDGELALVCTSSAWAARLRFESGALLKIAADQGVVATHCKVRVARQE